MMSRKTNLTQPFQIFAKPVGPACNLHCTYCYYLEKAEILPHNSFTFMPDAILETYIRQHIEACADPVIFFSWHGGEPTLAGLDFYRKVIDLQCKFRPSGQQIMNGIQTNGTILTEDWCRFLSEENFYVGISMDGPPELHDKYRLSKTRTPTHKMMIRGYDCLKDHGISPEILCVVHSENVQYPLEVYEYFRKLNAEFITFIPLVERGSIKDDVVSARSVISSLYGDFLCTIFDEWKERDIGRIKVQIFEEALQTAFCQEHTLCIFKEVCGRVPVIEINGDFYSCDHFVDGQHFLGNIQDRSIAGFLESPQQMAFGNAKRDSLPEYCQNCEAKAMCNGGCPKNRFIKTPDGEQGLNYLCVGYKKFFLHCKPYVDQISALWNQQTGA